MTETANTYNEIIEDKKINESEFSKIENKFNWLNNIQKQNLQEQYKNLKNDFENDSDKIIDISKDSLSLLKVLFLPENKEEIQSIDKLAEYFNITDNKKLDSIISKLVKAWLEPSKLLNDYKKNIESKLSWLKSIKDWEKYLEKIKLSIWRRFTDLDTKFEDLKSKVPDWKSIYDYKWDMDSIIQENFSDINNKVFPSVAFLISEWWKVNGTTSYLKYIASNWNHKWNLKIQTYKKIEETIAMLNANVLENWDFDKTWTSWEIIDANTNTWNIFNTDWTIEGSTDKATLWHKWIKAIEWVSTLSEADKKIEKDSMTKMMALIVALAGWALMTWPIWALADAWYNVVDFFKDEDLAISMLKKLPEPYWIPGNFHMTKTFLDNIWAFIWMIPLVWIAKKWIKVSQLAAKYNIKMADVNKMSKVISKELSETSKVEKAISKTEINTKPNINLVKRNAKLKPQDRLDKASLLLWKNFSKNQEKAILDAHNIWKQNRESWIYNYTFIEIKQKHKILKDAWFTKEESKILMDNGIVGKMPWKWFSDWVRWLTKTNIFSSINNFTELEQHLQRLPNWWLQWSVQFFSSKQLINIIQKVRNWNWDLTQITNTWWLRDKVSLLIKIEKTEKISINFSSINSFKELGEYLNRLPNWWLQWSKQFYTSDQLMSIIQEVRNWNLNLTKITNTWWLRYKVKELLNNRYIEQSSLKALWPKWLNHITNQWAVWNCYFVAALNWIKNHPNWWKILEEMITIKWDWIWEVNFKWHNKPITITRSDLWEMWDAKINTNNIWDNIIERAHARIMNKKRWWISGETMYKKVRTLNGENVLDYSHSWGDSTKVFDLFFWKSIKSEHIDSDFEIYLKYNTDSESYIWLYSKWENDNISNIFKDYKWRNVNIPNQHAYTISNVDKEKWLVDVINPHNSWQVMTFKIENLENIFKTIYSWKYK